MDDIYFETPRLIIRKWHIEDAVELCSLMSDPRVHEYASSKPWDIEHTKNYINLIISKNFKSLDLFHAACVLKVSNTIIGITGLNPYLSSQPEIEWKLGVNYWGYGYATEIGTETVRQAFRTTNIEAIYGMAHPDNTASLKVLEKIGMIPQGLNSFHNKQYQFYKIDRKQFERINVESDIN